MQKLNQQEIDEVLEENYGNDGDASIRGILDRAAKQRKLSDIINPKPETD